MMKMNFSFSRNAVTSAFFLLLFLCMGTFASAQASLSDATEQILPLFKEYDVENADKDVATQLFATEFATLNSTNPNGGLAEATHSVKRVFIQNAVAVLKVGGTVSEALVKGYMAAAVQGQAFSLNVDELAVLEYYANMVSN